MKAIELFAEVDDTRLLQFSLPMSVLPGKVRVLILTTDSEIDDEVYGAWMNGVSHEWAEELSDIRQDIYSLDDGEPVHAVR